MSGFEGTAGLVRLALRRDRVRLPAWVLGVAAVTFGSGSAMGSTFPTQASLDAYAASVATSPALVAMSGPPIALDTLPGVVLNKVQLMTVLGVSLMAVLEVVRHTRAEEEDGRTELLRAGVVGRHAGSAAALLVACAAATAMGLLVALALGGAQVPAGSSLLYGLSTAALGWVFAALALLLAQVFTHARAAAGAAVAVLGLATVVRAAGDVRDDGLVWLSPVGWSQATHVLGDERWWPLLVCVAAAVLLAAAAVGLATRRDVGSGLVATRPGPARAAGWLGSPLGLAVRQQRAMLAWWAVGSFALTVATGSLSQTVADMVAENSTLARYLRAGSAQAAVDAFLATELLLVALLAGAFGVASASRLRTEESSDRLESLLAAGTRRMAWLASGAAVSALGVVVMLLAGGLGLGTGDALARGDGGQPWRLAGLALGYAPAALSLVAVSVLVLGWRPAWGGLAWAAFAACAVLGWLGPVLGLPDAVLDLSPFAHVARVPLESQAWGGPALTLAGVVVLGGLGAAGLRRRDIG